MDEGSRMMMISMVMMMMMVMMMVMMLMVMMMMMMMMIIDPLHISLITIIIILPPSLILFPYDDDVPPYPFSRQARTSMPMWTGRRTTRPDRSSGGLMIDVMVQPTV
jgi:hypothetical protein